ncbi:MAG TPA: zinc-ribbon domain-containing protein [Sedimentisphaerales bacterium]|nr:zinc-ribbon domain-containing protein [Sedimentisphaerales bacterium]
MEEEKIDSGHGGVRKVFRVAGPVVAVFGLVLLIIGFVSLISSFGSFEPPRYFWCSFVGMPLLFVGAVLCMFGFMGKVARYQAAEIGPVARDAFNYMAEGTEQGIKTVAGAIGKGLREAATTVPQAKVRCHKCNNLAEENAQFCSSCGAALGKSKACPTCKELNDPDAKFCDNCGFELA